MIGPSSVVSLISVGVRTLAAAKYGKLYDRQTWIFNGTSLLVSFAVKTAFSWSVRSKNLYGSPVVTTASRIKEFGVIAASQIAGHFVSKVASTALGQYLARDSALTYPFSAGVASDILAILESVH